MSPAVAPDPSQIASIAQEMGIPIGGNPMKPADMVIHPSFSRLPPKCPDCQAYLFPFGTDSTSGNQLFQCLNGDLANAGHYLAVWKVASQTWGQRPGFEREGWVPPGFDKKKVKATKKKVVKAKSKAVKVVTLTKKAAKHKLVKETMPQDG